MGATDLAAVIIASKTTFLEIARQAANLGTGLQNAAPGDKAGSPNQSIQYLLETADKMHALAEKCDTLAAQLNQK